MQRAECDNALPEMRAHWCKFISNKLRISLCLGLALGHGKSIRLYFSQDGAPEILFGIRYDGETQLRQRDR